MMLIMKSAELYQQLEKDFITKEMSDDWAPHMSAVADFLCDNFKQRSMGLVCDFATEINRVYTAVFPSDMVLTKIINDNVTDALLFVHHPSIWDIRSAEIFKQMNVDLLGKLKERHVAIYNLHVPLDNYGEYSTSVTLARVLGIKIEKAFAPYYGAMAGVIGRIDLVNIDDLRQKFETVIGHQVGFYPYGDKIIKNNLMAIVAGGGNEINILEEVIKEGVNTFVTGITVKNTYSQAIHKFAEKQQINILGGTHYSTEKFACLAMVDYFKKLGLSAEYVVDEPMVEDV